MPDNTTSPTTPAPDSGPEDSSNVTPMPVPHPKRRAASDLNREQWDAMSLTLEICAAAAKAEYAPALADGEITSEVVAALVLAVETAQGKSRSAAGCTSARKGATQSEATAKRTLVRSLRQLQSKARKKHLPGSPHELEDYQVGQRLDESRTMLEAYSNTIIAKADAERPGGINTAFITRVQEERTAYVEAHGAQSSKSSQGRQEREQHDAMVKAIVELRKVIQYAADGIWTPGHPDHVQARKDFKLPANRPYSY